jgi:hypothetical protein
MDYVVFVLAVCVIKIFRDEEALEGTRARLRAVRAEWLRQIYRRKMGVRAWRTGV